MSVAETDERTILTYLNDDCWHAVLEYVPLEDILRTESASQEWQKAMLTYLRVLAKDDFKQLKIDKRIKRELQYIKESDFCLLWPNGKPIAPAKLVDLQSMYHYIPEDCLQFYRTLQSSEEATDDVDRFGRVPDFEIIEYDDD